MLGSAIPPNIQSGFKLTNRFTGLLNSTESWKMVGLTLLWVILLMSSIRARVFSTF